MFYNVPTLTSNKETTPIKSPQISSFCTIKSPNVPSAVLLQVSLPLTPSLIPLFSSQDRPFTIAQHKNLKTCSDLYSQTDLKCHFLQDVSLIFDLCKELIFPSFVLWRHKGDHFFSLSWHLYICFYLCFIKASLSHPLD